MPLSFLNINVLQNVMAICFLLKNSRAYPNQVMISPEEMYNYLKSNGIGMFAGGVTSLSNFYILR